MGDGGRDFWHELSGLADAFADLGRRLLAASRQLHAPGVLPSSALVEEVGALRALFDVLRAEVVARAEGLEVPVPEADALGSLKGLAALLDEVGVAEARRLERETRTLPALAVLDRVLALEHAHEADFPPLRACQEQARALRQAIANGPIAEVSDQVDGLNAMDHPFDSLIRMVEGSERVSDDHWEGLFEAVAGVFGTALAAAAGRARIVERPRAEAPPSAEEPAEAPAAPARSWRVDEPSTAGGVGEPILSVAPTFRAGGADGPGPLVTAELHDALISSIVAEAIPFLPRSLSGLVTDGTGADDIAGLWPGSYPVTETADPEGPVATLQGLEVHQEPTRFVLTFNTALDPASASDPANYRLIVSSRDGRLDRHEVPLRSAAYGPAGGTVTLTTLHELNTDLDFQLTVSGLRDACGRPVVLGGDGPPGDDVDAAASREDLRHPAPAGPEVSAPTSPGWAAWFPRLAAGRMDGAGADTDG